MKWVVVLMLVLGFSFVIGSDFCVRDVLTTYADGRQSVAFKALV